MCNSLPIKQLCSNQIYYFLSLCLQLARMDQFYKINIQSEMIGVISFCLIWKIFALLLGRSAVQLS